MPKWLCAFDLKDADEEDYEEIYIRVHQAEGTHYWKNKKGKYFRYPSTTFELFMEATSSSDALDEFKKFLQSCTDKKITHTAVGGNIVSAWSISIDADAVPEEIQVIIG